MEKVIICFLVQLNPYVLTWKRPGASSVANVVAGWKLPSSTRDKFPEWRLVNNHWWKDVWVHDFYWLFRSSFFKNWLVNAVVSMSTLKNIKRFLLIFPLQWQSCSMYTESKHRKQDTHNNAAIIRQRHRTTFSLYLVHVHSKASSNASVSILSQTIHTSLLNYGLETTTNDVSSFLGVWAPTLKA